MAHCKAQPRARYVSDRLAEAPEVREKNCTEARSDSVAPPADAALVVCAEATAAATEPPAADAMDTVTVVITDTTA